VAERKTVNTLAPAVAGERYNLAELWNDTYAKFRGSRRRIAESNKLKRNEVKPHVPLDVENSDSFRITIPHGVLMVQNIVQYLTRKQPAIRRPGMPGPVATRMSDKVEHWLGAPAKGGALAELRSNGEYLWESFCAHGANDGEYAVRVLPRTAAWSHLIDFAEEDPGTPEGTRIHPYFERDTKGRTREDDFYADGVHDFELDEIASSKAYDEYEKDAKARALPFVVEVLHPDVVLPTGVDPQSGKVDVLLVRTQRSVRSLQGLGFEWDIIGESEPVDATSTLRASQALLGGGKQMILYELMVPGGIYYQIGETPREGNDSSRAYPTYMQDADGGRQVAFLNLAERYGIEDIPGGYFYGSHHPDELNPDLKGIPLLSIFAPIIMGINQTISSVVHHAYEVGFGGWFADPSGIDAKYWTEAGKPIKVKVNRGAVTYVAGKISPAVHAGVDKDVTWFIEMGLKLLENFGPGQSLTGGDASDGGFAQAVAQASGENAIGQILNGSMGALKRTCECLLEQCSALSEEIGEPVPIYARFNPLTGEHKELVELSAKDLAGDWTVEVIFPMRKGTNLPLAQAMFQWWKGGALSLYTWLQDGWGEEQPDEEVDRINVEKALASDQGQKLMWDEAARIKGDREMAKIANLQQAGKMGPGGTPAALIPPRPSGDMVSAAGTPTNGMAGVQTGNPAASALGGIMSGQMMTGPQAQVAMATGGGAQMPEGGVPGATMGG
jgi:hypothetical protein